MKKNRIILSYIAIFIILPITGMEFPLDIWKKIIACSTIATKNELAHLSTTFSQLSKRTNLCIYLQSPLVLSKKDLQFGLLYATYYGNSDAVENLLQHGASADFYDSLCHLLPLTLAKSQKNQNHRLISILEKHKAPCDTEIPPLYAQAVYFGDLPTLTAYEENKDNTSHYTSYDDNPILHSAISNGHTHIVEYLLKDPCISDFINHKWNKMTPLHCAAQHNRPAITQLLLQADPSMINERCKGFTALHTAVYHKYYHVAEVLLNHPEIKVNFCTPTCHIAPLHTAIKNGDLEMVRLLLSAPRIIVNIKNNDNKTPLDIANKLSDKEIQKLLIEKEAKTFFYLNKIAPWEKKRKNIVKKI